MLERLERWYGLQCNGDWEYGEGVEIGTFDNSGWKVRISLADTGLQSRSSLLPPVRSNLTEALSTFLSWADA